MRFVWTYNKRFFGFDLICWGLGEPVSHFGIEWSNGMVSHWTLTGYEYVSKEIFYKKRFKKFELGYVITGNAEKKIINKLSNNKNQKYDYYYMFWLTFNAIARLIAKVPIPYDGTSDNPNNVICHEAIEEIPEMYRPKYDESMANTPYRLYKALGGEG